MNVTLRLKNYRERNKLSHQQMADKLGLKSQQAYTYKEEKGNDLSLNEILDFSNKLGVNLLSDVVSKNVLDKHEEAKNILEENGTKYGGNNIDMLIDSNNRLAKANQDIAAAALELTQMAKVNFASQLQNGSGVEAMLSALLVLVSEVGAGKRWGSEEEALADINSRFHQTSLKKQSIHSD